MRQSLRETFRDMLLIIVWVVNFRFVIFLYLFFLGDIDVKIPSAIILLVLAIINSLLSYPIYRALVKILHLK